MSEKDSVITQQTGKSPCMFVEFLTPADKYADEFHREGRKWRVSVHVDGILRFGLHIHLFSFVSILQS